MQEYKLIMVRDHMEHIPQHALPEGYVIRPILPGEEEVWAEIQRRAGGMDRKALLQVWENEYAPYSDELNRVLMLTTAEGEVIGSVSAWFGEIGGAEAGRIHWVAIVPEYQGRGLCKPMMTAAMNLLKGKHAHAYLTTQTTSQRAIGVYLNFGFSPLTQTSEHREGWKLMAQRIGHPAIAQFLSEGLRNEEKTVEYIPVQMEISLPYQYPRPKLPDGYYIRGLEDMEKDRVNWARVIHKCGLIANEEDALKTFDRDLPGDLALLSERCLFVCAPDGTVAGTTSGWFLTEGGREIGVIHWVGVDNDFQGRGLGKPLLTAALDVLAKHYDYSILNTQTTRQKAVPMYLDYGFRPRITTDEHRRGWKVLAQVTGHPLLKEYL
jgi:ribosomal protein S18 acetylase RimI-like enzyme